MLYNSCMIKNIKVFSRHTMEGFISNNGLNFPFDYWYLISIHSGDILVSPTARQLLKNIGCQSLISMNFWDVTPEDKHTLLKKDLDVIIFEDSHALKIIKFIDRVQKDSKDSTLIVHCHAGISRSGAVGTFACDYCGLNYNEFIKENYYVQPNSHILRTLRSVAKMTPNFEVK